MKLIITDLDGTLLHDDKQFNGALLDQVLQQLDQAGDHFVIATGRELKWVQKVFKGFTDRIDIVASNGAVVKPVGQPAVKTMISQDTLSDLQHFLTESGPLPTGGLRTYTDSEMYLVDGMGQIEDTTYTFMQDLYGQIHQINSLTEVPDPVTTVTGRWDVKPEDGTDMMTRLNDSELPVFATTSGYGTVDILPEGVNKAVALARLMHRINPGEAGQMVAFGDGMNDYEMLQAANQGYVMPNGTTFLLEQPEFKHVTEDNNHDGVLKTILSWA
ncbi:HAD family hydrolase [Weissella viridescens]|uniref:HAD family hydrolase n=1 Tax=Weissella viridescens TaxID=1629 RepID=UPI00405715E8